VSGQRPDCWTGSCRPVEPATTVRRPRRRTWAGSDGSFSSTGNDTRRALRARDFPIPDPPGDRATRQPFDTEPGARGDPVPVSPRRAQEAGAFERRRSSQALETSARGADERRSAQCAGPAERRALADGYTDVRLGPPPDGVPPSARQGHRFRIALHHGARGKGQQRPAHAPPGASKTAAPGPPPRRAPPSRRGRGKRRGLGRASRLNRPKVSPGLPAAENNVIALG
jgi:hypothetical protein